MILSITRSVKRLSAGALEVERGNLDHRVPVKRRDQLGDLGRSFNHMTGSVQSMLDDVAEKERLAQELELAREIQESLLPARHLDLGRLTVRATFQPAAEVGGDYFDVFPISEDRLVVAIGDVAGHGLSTGLLMASPQVLGGRPGSRGICRCQSHRTGEPTAGRARAVTDHGHPVGD